ncbi:MAG: biotin--[acetyl-CoA-carboxylase] ligase [Gammaproteobacteria bacterium]
MNQLKKSQERLNLEKIQMAIEPENQAFLANFAIFDVIDSTNNYLLAQAKNGAPSGSICLAEEQTAGRGRRGRKWISTSGDNIACSILWKVSENEDISSLSIAVAVMVVYALRKYGVTSGLQLKWPNDVLFDGRKLAGILLERCGDNIVIGLGLNLYLSPQAEPSWIGIYDMTGQEVRCNYLTGLLINELLTQLRVYQHRGLSAFIEGWRRYDMLQNRPISVHTPERVLSGTMRGINNQGELLLQVDKETVLPFCYGEVSIRF